jgi:hypothetical protein
VLRQLPDVLQTFSSQSKRTVSSLLQSVKGDKTQISTLVQNLKNFDNNANYTPSLAINYSLMNVESVLEFFRDSSLRINEFFSAASSISNVLNSMVSIFSSEVQKLEKDISYLENFIDNYQFIVGEDDLFNFNYIENFDNNINSSINENSNIKLVDRDGVDFNENGNYKIDTVLSKMSVSTGASFINPLENIQSISNTDNNYSHYITTDTGFDLLFNEDKKDNWSVTVKAPTLLTAQMPQLSKYVTYDTSFIRGAQSVNEVNFYTPIEMDFIRIAPSDANGLQLLQVVLVKTDPLVSQASNSVQGEYVDFPVLHTPLLLNKSVDIVFEKSKVKKIIFIFNQSKYIRSENTPIKQEINSKVLRDIVNKKKNNRKNKSQTLQDIVYFYFNGANSSLTPRKNTTLYSDYYSNKYPNSENYNEKNFIERMYGYSDEEINAKVYDLVEDKNSTPIENIVQSIVQHAIDSRSNIFNTKIYRSSSSNANENLISTTRTDGFIPVKNDEETYSLDFQNQDALSPGLSFDDVSKYLENKEISNSYEYSFSLSSIAFGVNTNQNQNKACFVSKKVEMDGAPLGIKGIVNVVRERRDLSFSRYDLKEAGSYELSVCWSDVIDSERSWTPLMSEVDGKIDSEVLFFDGLNLAQLRFSPNPASIKIYKNGMFENPNLWSYSQVGNYITYNEPVDKNAIYVAEYEVDLINYKQNIVDIDQISSSNFAVRTYAASGTPGEKFNGTSSGNKITLSYIPFIEDKFSTAVYNSLYGTINTTENIGYSPVIVTLNNGDTAVNLTNYTKNSFEKGSFYQTDQYLFFQNGKELIFNKPIADQVSVKYSYIPSSLRFRLIIRNNIPGIYNGISIDNVILKCKVKNLDPFSEKLLRLN